MKSRALVFDVYGEYFRYRGGEAKLGILTPLMGIFGIEPATVRTVMTRLRREGWFDSTKSGREVTYVLNGKSWRLLDNGRARIFDRPLDDWDRTWTQALVDVRRLDREARKSIETALSWWGFGRYQGSIWFSPRDREKRVSEMLRAGDDRHVQFLRSSTAGPPDDRLIAERCWDLADLGEAYRAFIGEFQPRLAHYRNGMDGRAALVERMTLVQEYRRYPFLDPDLPDSLLPPGWRGNAAHGVFLDCHEALRAASESFLDEVCTDV